MKKAWGDITYLQSYLVFRPESTCVRIDLARSISHTSMVIVSIRAPTRHSLMVHEIM